MYLCLMFWKHLTLSLFLGGGGGGGDGGRDLLSTDVLIVICMYMYSSLDVEWQACGLFCRLSTVDKGDENCILKKWL